MADMVRTRVAVQNVDHGEFVVDADKLFSMIQSVTGDVNYELRILRAWVSETTSRNYFQADPMTIFAAIVEFGFETHTVHWFLAQDGLDAWEQEVRQIHTLD